MLGAKRDEIGPRRDGGAPDRSNDGRQRLDLALVALGLVATRARARDLVLRGEVSVDGQRAARPATSVLADSRIELSPGAGQYVSRGAIKLRAALDAFGIDVAGRVAVDIGAAQGGFTQVLLERGAARVYAVENGRGQLASSLSNDARVVSLEATDARLLSADVVPEAAEIITADVSFISLGKALPAVLKLATRGAVLVALIKPQFELGPGEVGKDGVVKSEDARRRAVESVERWLRQQDGWRVLGVTPSPVAGGTGNAEYLIGAVKSG